MQISELKDGTRNVSVEGMITKVGETRIVNLRAGGQAEVSDATLTDESGSITLTLWDRQIEQAKMGKHVTVNNGYINSYRGEVRLNVGRFGSIEVS